MDYKNYVAGQIETTRAIEAERDGKIKAIKAITHKQIGSAMYAIPPEHTAAMIDEVTEESGKKINGIFNEMTETLSKAKKTAIQELTAVQPTPTAEQKEKAADLVKQYQNSKDMQKQLRFEQERDFHFDNDTVMVYPYILATQQMFPDGKIPVEWLDKIEPTLPQKREVLRNIAEAENSVEVYQLTESLLQGGLSTIQSISAKTRLTELGANPNPIL